MKRFLKEYKAQIILGILMLFLMFIAYEYYYKYSEIFKNPHRVKKFIMSYGNYSILAFVLLQILQVIAFFIPGELVQIAGGYIYGTLWGTIISLLGITLGSAMAYSISNRFGKPFVKKLISQKDTWLLHKLEELNSKGSEGNKLNKVILVLYLIPGIPKDILAYICGILEITFKDFILYSTLGRIPGIFISAYFGAKFSKDNMIMLIIIAIAMTALFLVGVLKGKSIISKITHK